MKVFVKTSKIHLSAVSILPINREVMMMMMMMINIRIIIGAMKTSKIHLSAISVLSIKKKGDCLPYPSLPPPFLSPCTELTAHESTRDSDMEGNLSYYYLADISIPSPGGKADQRPLHPPSACHPPRPPPDPPTRWCQP